MIYVSVLLGLFIGFLCHYWLPKKRAIVMCLLVGSYAALCMASVAASTLLVDHVPVSQPCPTQWTAQRAYVAPCVIFRGSFDGWPPGVAK